MLLLCSIDSLSKWGMAMAAMQFQHGERVRSRITIGSVRVGTLGTVLSAWPTAANVYSVQFVDTDYPYLMDAHMMSRLPRRRIAHAGRRRIKVWRNRAASGRHTSFSPTLPSSMPLLRAPLLRARINSYSR
jgi:hypothetical protein